MMTERNYETLLARVREYFNAKNAEILAKHKLYGTRGAKRQALQTLAIQALVRRSAAEKAMRDEIKIEKED